MTIPNYHMVHAQLYTHEWPAGTSFLLTVPHTPYPLSHSSIHGSTWPAVYHSA